MLLLTNLFRIHYMYTSIKFYLWSFLKIFYKKTDERYIEWQRVITNDKNWQRVVQRVTTNDNEWLTTSDNEWQRLTTSGKTNDKEWQLVAESDKEWQWVTASDSEWQQLYSEWKRRSTLQIIDDCHHFNDKKRYTSTSRDEWLRK